MSDAWAELQALKSKRDSRRKLLEQRKKERQDILRGGNPLKTSAGAGSSAPLPSDVAGSPSSAALSTTSPLLSGGDFTGSSSVAPTAVTTSAGTVSPGGGIQPLSTHLQLQGSSSSTSLPSTTAILSSTSACSPSSGNLSGSSTTATTSADHLLTPIKKDGESLDEGCFEEVVLRTLSDVALHLPMDSRQLLITVNKTLSSPAQHNQITNLLQKFAVQLLISIEDKASDEGTFLEIISADHTKLSAMITSTGGESSTSTVLMLSSSSARKRKAEQESWAEDTADVGPIPADEKKAKENDVLSLLSLASTRERENKRIGEEILELLSRPSAKEKTLAERFRSQGGNVVKEFCPHGTKSECRRVSANNKPCSRLHFRKIIQSHTDESLGDCSFLNTCFHMETCKYVHYEVDSSDSSTASASKGQTATGATGVGGLSSTVLTRKENLTISENSNGLDVAEPKSVLFPPQWVFCDLRYFDMTVLGKFSVIMADPPWDIHMELPYGTLSDDEMRHLNIPALQDEGLIFLWVTGRAMELGRECLQLWGYERVDELIWVKTNQLQRIIRTGRTGHWLNHGKEHCLVGMKGNPPINRGLDCDVIVAEVRATSHKPDEIYGIIERLSPGTRKIELFGRPHNIQPNWITLGNQLEGSHIVDDEVRGRFISRYPDGNCTVVKTK